MNEPSPSVVPAQVTVVDHPLVQHKLTLLRRVETSTNNFRRLLSELSALLAYEVLRDVPMHEVQINTPLEPMTSRLIDGKKVCLVSILRAGAGILDGFLSVVPGRAGRPHRAVPRPQDARGGGVLLQDAAGNERTRRHRPGPMLATGNSAVAAVDRLKETGPKSIKFVCLLTAPEGIRSFHESHPDVPIFTASIDRQLNDHGYILPGLGDAGDRIFGTK
jgi:uracil phosphoribosyltransferase